MVEGKARHRTHKRTYEEAKDSFYRYLGENNPFGKKTTKNQKSFLNGEQRRLPKTPASIPASENQSVETELM